MGKKIRAKRKNTKIKIIDENNRLIDSLNFNAVEDTLEMLKRKYGSRNVKQKFIQKKKVENGMEEL